MQRALRKVFLVDDDLQVSLLLAQAYRGSGPYFITAASANEALRKMELFSFDLFLLALDRNDPGRQRLTQVMEKRYPQIPLILLEKSCPPDVLTALIERSLSARSRTQNVFVTGDAEKRDDLRTHSGQSIRLAIGHGDSRPCAENLITATLTDISDRGLGLVTHYALKKFQPIQFSDPALGRSGVVAWSSRNDRQTCRAGIRFC